MKVFLVSPRGFCAGVVRAIDIVEVALARFGAPIYVKHQIVHNQTVVQDLEKRGVITVERIDEIPPNANVVFSAHGSPPSDYETARKLNLNVVDATCPLVTKVHNEARKYHNANKKLILIGHTGHQEVIGTMGHAPMHLIDENDAWQPPDWEPDEDIAVVTQTTLSVNDTAKVVDKLKSKFNNLTIRNDICYATTNRQKAVAEITPMVSLMLVVGSVQSSNCTRLRELAAQAGLETYLVQNAAQLDMDWLAGHTNIGVTAGASTPEEDVQQVIQKIAPTEVVEVGSGPENIVFKLPDVLAKSEK